MWSNFIASIIGKLLGSAARVFGWGGGTAVPGLVAETLSPNYLNDLLESLSEECVFISGTNGKTTSTSIVAKILTAHGMNVIQNRSGSNLSRGLLSELLQVTDWRGRLSAGKYSAGVFEVDEAVLPSLLVRSRPRVILLTNLFRDQLDRYGELDMLSRRWRDAIARSDRGVILVANADDPAVVYAASKCPGKTFFFGMEGRTSTGPDEWADATLCPACAVPLVYDGILYSHLGHYRCDACGFERPTPLVIARNVQPNGLSHTSFDVEANGLQWPAVLPLPGTYNVYNALAAIAVSMAMGVSGDTATSVLAGFAPVFGRGEQVSLGTSNVTMLLIKNPAGANEVIRSLAGLPGSQDYLILLNDNVADGEDVSWIWDVDFGKLRSKSLVVGGRRREDMALRLKYAGLKPAGGISIEADFHKAMKWALESGRGQVYVLATYTAMLEFRSWLGADHEIREFWR